MFVIFRCWLLTTDHMFSIKEDTDSAKCHVKTIHYNKSFKRWFEIKSYQVWSWSNKLKVHSKADAFKKKMRWKKQLKLIKLKKLTCKSQISQWAYWILSHFVCAIATWTRPRNKYRLLNRNWLVKINDKCGWDRQLQISWTETVANW